MSDLTDERIAELVQRTAVARHVDERAAHTALLELQRYRATHAADEERVRSVVREAVVAVAWPNDDAGSRARLADAIAARAAKQLASAAVRLSDVDRALIDAGLGVLTSDYNDVPHDKIAELRERIKAAP